MKLNSELQSVKLLLSILKTTVRSQVLVPELNLAMSVYFYTYVITIKSILLLLIIIITIILVNNLISADYLCLKPLIIAL